MTTQSKAQQAFEKSRRDWLGPDLTDEEAAKLKAATPKSKFQR
jgi:hypothetical protein